MNDAVEVEDDEVVEVEDDAPQPEFVEATWTPPGTNEHWKVEYCTYCFPDGLENAKVIKVGLGYQGIFRTANHNSTVKTQHIKKCREAAAKAKNAPPPPQPGLRQTTLDSNLPMTEEQVRLVCDFLSTQRSFRILDQQEGKNLFLKRFREVGLGCTSKSMKQKVKDIARCFREQVAELLKGKCIVLQVDGGTINRKAWLNCTVSFRDTEAIRVFFWKTKHVPTFNAEEIMTGVREAIIELREAGAIVVAVCSDNASAMKKALESEELLGPVEPTEKVQADGESEGEDPQVENGWEAAEIDNMAESPGSFFYRVPCWAHGFQLVVGDACSGCCSKAVEIVKRVLKGLSRSQREEVSSLATNHGKTQVSLVVPAVTRWNSSINAMKRIFDLRVEINSVRPDLLNDADLFHLSIAISVLVPLGIATDRVQSTQVGLENGLEIFYSIYRDMNWIKSLNLDPTISDELIRAVDEVTSSLETRYRLFSSHLVMLFCFFDVRITAENQDLSAEQVLQDVEQFLLDKGEAVDERTRASLLASFRFIDSQRSRNLVFPSVAEFWKQRETSLDHRRIADFVEMLSSILLTEGSVERSYKAQAEYFSKTRNRMLGELVEEGLFIKLNRKVLAQVKSSRTSAAQQQPKPTKEISHTMSHDDWRVFVAELHVPTVAENAPTRKRQNEPIALRRGSRILTTFVVDKKTGVRRQESGTVVAVISATKFRVAYDDEADNKRRVLEKWILDTEEDIWEPLDD